MSYTRDSRLMPSAEGGADLPTVSVWVDLACTAIRLNGEWDVTVCDRLHAVLVGQVQAGARNLVVDLSGVVFLDLPCLHALLAGGRTAERAGGTLQIVSPPPMVVRLMALID
jgi:anti-anti-sigma factor